MDNKQSYGDLNFPLTETSPMYVYVCVYIYIYIYIYVFTHVCIYIYTHISVYTYIYIYSARGFLAGGSVGAQAQTRGRDAAIL